MVLTVISVAAMCGWPTAVAGAQRITPVAVRRSAASMAARSSATAASRGEPAQRPSKAKYALVGAGIGVLGAAIAWDVWADSEGGSEECIGCEFVVGGTIFLSAVLGALVGLLVWALRY